MLDIFILRMTECSSKFLTLHVELEFPHGHPSMGDDVCQIIFLDKLIAINKSFAAIKIKVTNKTFKMITQVNKEIFSTLIYITKTNGARMICVMTPGTIIKTETQKQSN